VAIAEERVRDEEERDKGTSEGRILTITGPVIEVEFPPERLPEIGFALEVGRDVEGKKDTITAEVSQHIGDSAIKAICMKNTDGLQRGAKVINTGQAITVPVGNAVLGHVYNVLGEPVDGSELPDDVERWPIHRQPPKFEDLEPKTEMLKPASRSSTCSSPTSRVAKSACSAVPESARPSSSRR